MLLCDLEIFYSTIKFLSALLLKGLSNIHIFKLEGYIFSVLTLVICKIMKLKKEMKNPTIDERLHAILTEYLLEIRKQY